MEHGICVMKVLNEWTKSRTTDTQYNEGINQRYLKKWADVADKICFGNLGVGAQLVRHLILLQTHKCLLLIMGLHIFEIKLC